MKVPMTIVYFLKKFTLRVIFPVVLIFSFSGTYAQTNDPDKLKQFEESILRGEDFLQAKEYARAKAEYQKALIIDPSAKYPKDKLTYIRKFYIDPEDEARFVKAMESGNQLLTTRNFTGAIEQYQIAVNTKPEDKNARENMAKAEKLAAEQQETDKQYTRLITEADKLLNAKDLTGARIVYTEASKIKANETYPKQRISEIDSRVEAEKSLKDSYDKALTEGDEAYMNRDFVTARLKYEMALKIKPGENYPRSMLERVAQGSEQMKDALQNYQQTIVSADKLYNANDYTTALQAYQNASKILPAEKYPVQQIEKIKAILQQSLKLDEDYASTISEGNQFFDAKQYTEARSEFQKANDLKPGEAFPKQKIEEIALILLAIKDAERDKAYTVLITAADQLFISKDYTNARAKYLEASILKAEEVYPKDKINTINQIQAESQANETAYLKAVADADIKFSNAFYDESIPLYQSALSFKPGETYPAQQILKAREAVSAIRLKDESYNQAIAAADNSMEKGDADNALESYRQALVIKPGSAYPEEQIAKINTALADKKSKEEQYQKLIGDADQLSGSQSYVEAVQTYTQALSLKPQEKYPAAQISRINGIIESQQAIQTAYNQLIALADRLYDDAAFEKALVKYNEAVTTLPSDTYARDRISAINSLLEQRKSLDASFTGNLAEADKAFKSGDMENALGLYEKARILKPEEAYPISQIAQVKQAIADQKKLNDNYRQIIGEADIKYSTAAYEEAVVLYQSAISVKPDETYPVQQIGKAREAISALKQKEESYNKAVSTADQQYGAGDLENALKSYRQSLEIKPSSAYPEAQILKIDQSLTASRSAEEQFRKLIGDGDRLYQAQTYPDAVSSYSQALALKPQEKYPSEQIDKINGILEALKVKQTAYNQQIAMADKFFNDADFEKALAKYNEALAILPTEQYPQERIASVNNMLEQRKSLEENYTRNIAAADIAWKANDLENAVKAYEKAKALKPTEQYPQAQIALIEKRLASLQAENEEYLQLIAEADRLFKAGEADPALVKYSEALKLKPEDTYSQSQVAIINNQKARYKETEEAYRMAMTEADRLFGTKDMEQSLAKYREAQTLKPSEPLPGQQIAKINAILGAKLAADQQYNEALTLADQHFSSGNYSEAESAYQEARLLKPDEKYPTDQIALIAQKKAALQTVRENIQAAISEGDRLYAAKEYGNALTAYEKAQSLKPEDNYPRERISTINGILEEQRYLADKDYNDAIEAANRLFTLQDYTSAIKSYEMASAIRPSESYPKNKLLEINTILMERSRNQMDLYTKIIMKADLAYQGKIYDQAIDAYEEAIIAKPDEVYPVEMISKIRKYMEDHSMVELVSSPLVIPPDTEQKFRFKAIEMRLRKNNYIIIKARKTGEVEPKVYLNYGIDGQKSGGIVLRSIKSQETGDYLVRVSIQDKWYRLDNNWISVYAEGGEVEISKMQISQGD